MRNLTFVALLGALLLVGCEEKKENAESATGGTAGAPSASASPSASAAPTGSATIDGGQAGQAGK